MEQKQNSNPPAARRQRRRENPARRNHNTVLALLLLLTLVVFGAVNLFSGDREFSESENRKLAQRPDFSWAALADGSYFSELTDYVSDQFFARDGWISLKLRAEKLLGKKESGGVYLGKDGYLLAAPETPDQAALDKTVEAIRIFSAAHPDLSMQMMLVPCAAAVLPEKLPANAPVRDQLADIAAIEEQLAGRVQALPVSFAEAEEGSCLYYRTDHHWTSLGAFTAFSAAAGDMGIDLAGVSWEVYPVTDSFEGTLSSKSGSHESRDTIEIYVPETEVQYYVYYPDSQTKTCSLYISQCLQDKDQYTLFFGGNHPLVEIHTTRNNGRNLLVFKDSYANCFMQFLTPYYENILMIDPRYYYDSVESVIASNEITDVLFLYSADTFVKDSSLGDVLLAG